MDAQCAQGRYIPEQGMGMLGLDQVQLFWERSLDTKVLIGWSANTIVISVRGTASLKNAIADIQARSFLFLQPPHQIATLSETLELNWQQSAW